MEKFMPELADQQDRLLMLQTTAHKINEGNYDCPLTEEEIEYKKSLHFSNSNDIDDLELEKKELTKDLTDKIKDVKSRNTLLKREIRERLSKREGITFDVAEGDYMCTYDNLGELLNKRRLTPDDRREIQSKISFVPQSLKKAINQ